MLRYSQICLLMLIHVYRLIPVGLRAVLVIVFWWYRLGIAAERFIADIFFWSLAPGPVGTQKSVRIRGVPLLVRKQCHLCAHMNQRKFHFEYIQVKARDRSATLIFPYLLKPNDNSVVAARRYAESLITTVLLTLSSRAHVSQCPPCRDWHGSPVNYRRSDQIVVQHRREKW